MRMLKNTGIADFFIKKAQDFSNFIKKRKPGITLAEMMLALAIIGILAAILMPVLKSAQPDKLEALHKKGNYIVEHVVADIAFDDDLYPQTKTSLGLGSIGAVTVDGVTYAGDTKFCELFASRANKAPHSGTSCVANQKTFTSVEGIDWYLPVSKFDGSTPYETIKFDVNGAQAPNCTYDADTCAKPDTFIYYLKPNGKLYTDEPNQITSTYCVILNQVGPGSVLIRPKSLGSYTSLSASSCGKAPGQYEIKSVPAAGYETTTPLKTINITNSDVTVNVEFTLIPEPEMRKIIVKKIRNYGFLGSIFSADKISDGHVFLGDQEITFTGSGTNGCYSFILPGCKIYETVVEVEAGQYALWAKANEKSSVDKITPNVVDVSSKDGNAEVSFVWSYYDDQKYDVNAPITGDHYCFNGINNSTVSGTKVGQPINTNYDLTANPQGGCTWIWDLSDSSINYGNSVDKTVGGKIKDKDVNVPIRFIAPAGAVDENPIKHKVIVKQICPDGSSMCATVQGAGEYPEHTSGIQIKVKPYEGLGADWIEQTVSVGTEDVVLTVTMTESTYCIYTSINGSGTVQPTSNYCGLVNGTYKLTAVPTTGWEVKSGWTEISSNPKRYEKSVTIRDGNVNESVTFTKQEDRTYCINLTVNCPYGSANLCGAYRVTGISPAYPVTSFNTSGALASKCALTNGTYNVEVLPNTEKAVLMSTSPSTFTAKIDNSDYTNTIDFEKIKATLGVGLFVSVEGMTADEALAKVGEDSLRYKLILNDQDTGANVIFDQTVPNATLRSMYGNLNPDTNQSNTYALSYQQVPVGRYKMTYFIAYNVAPSGTETEVSNSVANIEFELTKNGYIQALVYRIYRETSTSSETPAAASETPTTLNAAPATRSYSRSTPSVQPVYMKIEPSTKKL